MPSGARSLSCAGFLHTASVRSRRAYGDAYLAAGALAGTLVSHFLQSCDTIVVLPTFSLPTTISFSLHTA